ncbi:unnamed protein product, partial [Cylicocyclus nassatus]
AHVLLLCESYTNADTTGENCFLPLKYRTELTKSHNGLRLFVARGLLDETHKKHLMYGVKYDCGLEEVARKIVHGENSADHYGVIRFSRENLGNIYGSIIDSFIELLDDKEQLKQAVYPPSTRFGCYSEIESGKKLVNAVCVYDSKYDSNFQGNGQGLCMKDGDCIYHESSICLGGLCFSGK